MDENRALQRRRKHLDTSKSFSVEDEAILFDVLSQQLKSAIVADLESVEINSAAEECQNLNPSRARVSVGSNLFDPTWRFYWKQVAQDVLLLEYEAIRRGKVMVKSADPSLAAPKPSQSLLQLRVDLHKIPKQIVQYYHQCVRPVRILMKAAQRF
jgi:hypothetical protein